ncbi:hypothetical protein MRX96_024090 [Rhipicephalus microplus]
MGLQRSEAVPTRLLLLQRDFCVPYYGPEAGISVKGSQPTLDSVWMKHTTTVTPYSKEKGFSSATENATGHCAAVTTPETHTDALNLIQL